MWVGRIFIVVFLICSISRLIYGIYGQNSLYPLAGRLFAFGVEWLQFLFSGLLEWYGKRMVKYHQGMREAAFEKKDKDGMCVAQDGIIDWTAFLRFLQGLVRNFFTEDEKKVETAAQTILRFRPF